MKKLLHRASYANVMATIAVFIALGGSAYAATQLKKNSVGTKQLKKNSVTTPKIKNGAVTGEKVNLSTLGTVPNAASANHAKSADTATDAASANHANIADNATNATNSANAQPVAFAHVSEEAVLDSADSKNVGGVTLNEVVGGNSIYCFSGLPFTPRGGQATLDELESGRNAGAQFALGTIVGCPGDTQAFVFTWEGTVDHRAAFYVVFYG